MVIWQILIGFIGGFFGGLGMGGGTVVIPLLTIFLGFKQTLAQGINLLAFVTMAIFSIIIHAKNGLIETRGLGYIILGGILFSCIGAFVAVNISADWLCTLFGAFLCVLAVWEVVKVFRKP